MSQIGGKGSVPGVPGLKKHQQAPIKDGSIFSLNAKKGRSGKFISHLLGLDHEQATNPNAPAATAGKASQPLKGIKFSDLFHGIRFTPNFMFFLLFLGFFLWLFVIYWVRHHEPLADSVLGTPKASARGATADRRLVEGIKTAFPVQTSATSGEVYVPGTPAPQVQPNMPIQANMIQPNMPIQANMVQPNMPIQANTAIQPAYSRPFTNATPIITPQSVLPYGSQQGTILAAPEPSVSQVQPGQGNYFVQTNTGARVKTIVNR